MFIHLELADPNEIQIAFDLLKSASEKLERKGIKQWDYWQDPPQEKTDWVQQGFADREFYWIKNEQEDILGMVRILNEDLLYWGAQTTKAQYIHSLVVHDDYAGQKIGQQVLDLIATNTKNSRCEYLRLDCDASNHYLCNYYVEQGFNKVGEKKLTLGTYNLYQKAI